MPPKNEPLGLSAGTLYFYPPEGGDPVCVGPVKNYTEVIEPERIEDGPCAGLCTAIKQTVTFEAEITALNLPNLWLLTRDPRLEWKWLDTQAPRRLVHLGKYAKKGRARTKNLRRLARLFVKEARA